MSTNPQPVDVVVIGGGTAGLSIATALKEHGLQRVVVLERETQPGGVPRHCGHYPFGVLEFKRLLKGPDYARKLIDLALTSGVDIQTGSTVIALKPGGIVELVTHDGKRTLKAQRVVLATGTRESTRAQLFVSGQRPQGVISTGTLQSLGYLHHKRPFSKPTILGSELVSLSAIMTCRHMGIKPVAMLEERTHMMAPAWMRGYPLIKGIPLHWGISDLTLVGNHQLEGLLFRTNDGKQHELETDGLIVSGRFTPESALPMQSHLRMDNATGGPEIDQFYRCSDPHYYCVGNGLRPVETSAWCWQEARKAARSLVSQLNTHTLNTAGHSLAIQLHHDALKYVVPQRIDMTDKAPDMEHLQLRVNYPVKGKLTVRCGTTELWHTRLKSRPERRILCPLKPITQFTHIHQPSAPLSISLEQEVS